MDAAKARILTTRRVVNWLIDMLIDEGVSKADILDELNLKNSDLEYYGIEWLNKSIRH